MKLSDKTCKNAKGKEKPYKLADGGGLYLEIMPSGSKCWRMKYRHLGKEKRLAFGVYPLICLADARDYRDRAKKLLAEGIDPSGAKRERRRVALRSAENTFKAVALEWHENQKNIWTRHHSLNVMRRFEVDVFPFIGNRPISPIDCLDLQSLKSTKNTRRREVYCVGAAVWPYPEWVCMARSFWRENLRSPLYQLGGAALGGGRWGAYAVRVAWDDRRRGAWRLHTQNLIVGALF